MSETRQKGWFVYLAQCGDGVYYCGVTTSLERRLAQHNGTLAGGARYTASRRPVMLLASLECAGRSEAQKLEAAVKKLARPEKLRFFRENGQCPDWK